MEKFLNSAISAFVLSLAAIISVSCAQQSIETTYSNQESRIDSFIEGLNNSANPPLDVVHRKGSNRIVLSRDSEKDIDGAELSAGGTVSFYFAGYVFSGGAPSAGSMFATNRREVAEEAGWELTSADYNVLTVNLKDDDSLISGLRNGLVGVHSGEICYIVFSGKYGFGDRIMGTIPENSALIYQIWVESIDNF